MKLYKIDNGIKLPAIKPNRAATQPSMAFATLQALKPGQSFLVRDAADAFKAAKVMRDMMRRDRERGLKREFASRQVKGGTRIWRVK